MADTGRLPIIARSERKAHEIARFLHGDHSDPFAFLGCHAEPDGGFVLRVFLPRALRVYALAGDGPAIELPRIDEAGLFAGPVAFAPGTPYRLRKIRNSGEMVELDDAYRFPPLLGSLDLHLISEGAHWRLYDKLGAHLREVEGVKGVTFALWAPNARRVSVVGDFNAWDGRCHAMRLRHESGIWEIFIPGLGEGALYKYEIKTAAGELLLKADPMGLHAEMPPKTASVVFDLGSHVWRDEDWMKSRAEASYRDAPLSIYEVHLGSWRRGEGGRRLSYYELAHELSCYVKEMGFTHIELLPIQEHPFDGSWGYQPVGMYAPTSRYGAPNEFRYFVEHMHREGIGVIIDWVAGHFPRDAHGLAWFDGTHLYEHSDPRQGLHQDWDTLIYNYGRREVANYLLANALFWLEQYHIDGLRVDAVASMLYLDYSRKPGEWVPNRHGGNENLEAIDFIRRMNELVYGMHPGVMTIAEESTAWPMVSRPTYLGGLGFGFKWNMGWMHDTLNYMSNDPVHRRWHHDNLTFGLLYAFTENFVLPLSHDEVVHGKRSILGRMPGDDWQRFANLRAYYCFMFASPGKKLLFMGCEFGQEREWNHDHSLDWHLLDDPKHRGVWNLLRDLNRLYRSTPALHAEDCEGSGFEWIDCHDRDHSIVAFLRKGDNPGELALIACNFTPVPRQGYLVGVPLGGNWREVLNSDAAIYGGSDMGNGGGLAAESKPWHGRPFSLPLTLPPLGVVIMVPE
jgi:1,4-alpha-glucan branching enzyme